MNVLGQLPFEFLDHETAGIAAAFRSDSGRLDNLIGDSVTRRRSIGILISPGGSYRFHLRVEGRRVLRQVGRHLHHFRKHFERSANNVRLEPQRHHFAPIGRAGRSGEERLDLSELTSIKLRASARAMPSRYLGSATSPNLAKVVPAKARIAATLASKFGSFFASMTRRGSVLGAAAF